MLNAAIGPIAALLAPVVLLLFAALRLRKRVRYPHGLLPRSDERRPAAVFLRSLRIYYDSVIDAACAVAVGLSIAGLPRPAPARKSAVVIDASLSMSAGLRGDRPIDEAARLALSDESLADSRLFVLGWDPASMRHELVDLDATPSALSSPQALAEAAESRASFMSADHGLVSGLAGRGFGRIVILSDDAALRGVGIEVRAVAAKPPRYVYPAQAAWDEAAGRSVARFVTAGGAAPEGLWSVGADGSLRRAKPEEYAIEPSLSGFELSFPEPGLWAVQWDGRLTPFVAPDRPAPVSASGSFAARLVAALGPAALVASGPGERPGLSVRDGGGRGRPGVLSVATAEGEPCVLPPSSTLGSVVAAGIDAGADLALGPAALASPETAIAFYLARAASAPRGLSASTALRYDNDPMPPPSGARRGRAAPIRVGEGFIYPRGPQASAAGSRASGGQALVVIPPLSEYETGSRETTARAGGRRDSRAALAILLGALYGLKLWLGASRSRTARGAARST